MAAALSIGLDLWSHSDCYIPIVSSSFEKWKSGEARAGIATEYLINQLESSVIIPMLSGNTP